MSVQNMKDVIPYAANFSVVVVLLVAILRKPARKFLYQRHERMKDAVESAAIAHRKAMERAESARRSMAGVVQEEASILASENRHAEVEQAEILQKADYEVRRVLQEAERLAKVEQEEASDRVKDEFLKLVVEQTENNLRQGLKKDDHSAILKRAQNSIEVGV